MEVFTMVVLIVAIACGSGVINNYLKNQRLLRHTGASHDLQTEVEDLKRRVAALEAIVTDERYHLNREFERLERQR
jgi:phage shock protein C